MSPVAILASMAAQAAFHVRPSLGKSTPRSTDESPVGENAPGGSSPSIVLLLIALSAVSSIRRFSCFAEIAVPTRDATTTALMADHLEIGSALN